MRATGYRPAGTWDAADATDRVVLDFDQRFRRRTLLRTEAGAEVLLDLPQAARLRDGDALVIDTGALIRVAAKPERLLEVAAESPGALARIAWHLGNRHLPVQILAGRLRLRDDHVIADMVRLLGAEVTQTDAPFDPEPGAYAGGGGHAHHHHDDVDDHGHVRPGGSHHHDHA